MDEMKNLLSKLGASLLGQPGLDDLFAMSSSTDGFKRENAVRRLGMLGNPLAIPYLIVRANDWVPQVRAAAYDALTRLLKTGNGEAFVASLPQILHLESCRRDDHSKLLQSVQEFLIREENRTALLNGLESRDSKLARTVVRLLVEHKLVATKELVTKGLAHSDVLVRSTVVDLLRDLEGDDFESLVQEAMRDPYMPVRREAFQQLLQSSRPQGLVTARELLFDRSASIREIAVRQLLAEGEPVEQIYASALAGNRDRLAIVRCVLWAWGLMNSRARIETVKEFLDSRFSTARRAALTSISKLLRADAAPYLERSLADPSPAVCNEAARLISRFDVAPDVETLIVIAKSKGPSHVARACCRVVRAGSKWSWLRFILAVYGGLACETAAEEFTSEIDAWEWRFNRSYEPTDPRQLEEIVRLFGIYRDRLSKERVRLLEFTLRTHGAKL
jgi:HEAT repeat protein